MKNWLTALLAVLTLGMAGTLAYENCCAPGAKCCYPGSPCCAKH